MNAAATPTAGTAPPRVLALDVFRGIVMFLLLFEGMVPTWCHRFFPESVVAAWIGAEFTHVPWSGCHLWDLIQPSFILMSGMAIPFALASRRARGWGPIRIYAGVLRRALTLIVLGLIIRSNF